MVGQTISHYKITAKLGEGGMGVVYRAEDTKLKRPVALKFIAANLIKDAEARKRFEREATAAAGVSHANICHVYEIADADGQTFLAMEYIEGESLDTKIARGPLPLKDALDLARQAAEGLAAAHEHGVVHRDIKPGNLLITPKGQLRILDFGLALLTEGSKLTQLDTKVGTVAYMSPEQAQGIEVDHRTDVWALGCVLYEMVSGRRPFLGHYDQALVYSIVNEPPEPLTGLRTGVPMELEFIVGKCLEKDPGSRYQQVSEIAVDLRNLQDKLKSGRSTILRGQVVSHAMPTEPTVTTQLPAGPLVRYRVIESLEDSAESAKYLAEDTQLQRSVSIRVLPQSSAERKDQTLLQ
jgi:serine/threonine protein kinase